MKNKLMLSLVVLLVAVSVLAVSAQDATTLNDTVSESVSEDNVISVDESDNDVLEYNSNDVLSVDDKPNVYKEFDVKMTIYYDSNHDAALLLAQEFTFDDVHNKDIDLYNNDEIVNNIIETMWKSSVFGDVNYRVVSKDISINFLNGGFTRYDVNVVLELNSDEDTPVENNTDPVENTTNDTNNTQNATNGTSDVENTTNSTSDVGNATVKDTNKNHIKPKDVAKETGIPFAALIVALLSAGILIRRRK